MIKWFMHWWRNQQPVARNRQERRTVLRDWEKRQRKRKRKL